jgi:hypothetical protein
VVDGVAGAVDLSQGPARVHRRPMHRRKEVGALTRLSTKP